MKNHKNLKMVVLFAFWMVTLHAQTIEREIRRLNDSLTRCLEKAQPSSAKGFYTDDVIFFPQYHKALHTKEEVETFYNGWVRMAPFSKYHKRSVDIETIGNRVVEVGTFSIQYEKEENQKTYSGNYLVVWRKDRSSYKIEAEAFVSNTYLPKSSIPHALVSVGHREPKYTFNLKEKVDKEVLDQSNWVKKTVEAGDTKGRINGFHKDAMYMPNYSEMKIGHNDLVPYLKKIYYPGAHLKTSHSYFDVRKIDKNHIIVLGHFKGGWDRPNDRGTFEGNMLNILKKDGDGRLLMYRQLSNSDR